MPTRQAPSKISTTAVRSVRELLDKIDEHTTGWGCGGNVRPWFRGQADAGEPLLPSVLRVERGDDGQEYEYDEVRMTLMFRLKALAFAGGQQTPETSRLDQWLFLMQHYGLPTRLLDWTENPLASCFFAAARAVERPNDEHKDRAHMGIWMIHPLELNFRSVAEREFPNTWAAGKRAVDTIKIAFGTANEQVWKLGKVHCFPPSELPIAVQPSNVAARVAVQRSCFTIHGTNREDFETLFSNTDLVQRNFVRKYVLPRASAEALLDELERMGVSHSTLFPDFEGLAKELKRRFRPPRKARTAFSQVTTS